ncbi:hypothetical protein HY523_02995, partial [Candidatus Berkelbacteria bacterium]|nr:hypothetical protein [Candidatus Berkelbacteria bacterium]
EEGSIERLQQSEPIDSQPTIAEAAAPDLEYEARLLNGEYIGPLETYGVQWSLEKVARDTLQNFFDGAQGTLDGVRFAIHETEAAGGIPQYTIRIDGDATYDYRELLHMGGTSKAGNRTTAGGFGEGTKALSLMLLRDFGFSDVRFGSEDWELDFTLQELPPGRYNKPDIRGLCAQLSKDHTQAGNFIEFTTEKRATLDAFVAAKDLFYSSENPDFAHPTNSVTMADGSQFGFTFLGLDEKQRLREGHLYDAGQRRHYTNTDRWDTVGGLHLWTRGKKVFPADRDRGAVSQRDVEKGIISPMIRQMERNQLVQVLGQLMEIWPIGRGWSFDPARKLLESVIDRLAEQEMTLRFDHRYLASTPFAPDYMVAALEQAGYTICGSDFAKLGMPSIADRYREMQEHFRTEPTPEQLRRIDILFEAVRLMHTSVPTEADSKLDPKEIYLYSKANEKSIIHGQYNERYVWLAEEALEGPFMQTLATYLHELDHQYGTDQSAEFSYALTDTLELLGEALLEHGEAIRALKNSWNQPKAEQRDDESTEPIAA